MPKKKKIVTYTIDELSPAARKTAIEAFRERAFNDHAATLLTEDFESMLEEKGILAAKANWSLSNCQGDGVCFSGDVDVAEVIRMNKLKQFAPLRAQALRDGVSARIRNDDNRYCHWNSMAVEVTLHGDPAYLFPASLREESMLYEDKKEQLWRDFKTEYARVMERNLAPQREWEKLFNEWPKLSPKNPQDWSPRVHHPGPKPAPLTEPVPSHQQLPRPPHLQEAVDEAEARWKELETLANEFEEWLGEWVEGVSKELEKIGYAEIEYRQSDEAIVDFFNGNEWKFLEDGERWR